MSGRPKAPAGLAMGAAALIVCAGGCLEVASYVPKPDVRAPADRGVPADGSVTPEDGPSTAPDGPAEDSPPPPDQSVPDGGCLNSSHCGPNARCSDERCECEPGFVNEIAPDWSQGCSCEIASCASSCIDPDAACRQTESCVPACTGANVTCLRYCFKYLGGCYAKCRCKNDGFKDAAGACASTSGCSATSCNACYTGYCGIHADCNQNKCQCNPGWERCSGADPWQYVGCQCAPK